MSVEVISYGNSSLKRPNPLALPVRLPKVNIDHEFVKSVRFMTGKDSCVIAYGSYYNKERTATSVADLLIVTKDVERFHKENIKNGFIDYGFPATVSWHTALNKSGPNYYQGSLPLGEGRVPIIAGVIGLEEFQNHARGAQKGVGTGHYYLAGRLQKPTTFILCPPKDPAVWVLIDESFNVARIDGFFGALSKVGEVFWSNEIARPYVESSYLADTHWRPDHPKSHWKKVGIGTNGMKGKETKTDRLLRSAITDYGVMFADLLEEFSRTGIIRPNMDGSYTKLFSLSEKDVDDWLKECSKYSLRTSMKNWLTSGFINGLGYAGAKAFRRYNT